MTVEKKAVSQNVVREDARLERAAENSRIDLAKHRWHWTLDESNPRRSKVADYARAVSRSHPTIADMVNGYAAWVNSGAPLNEFGDYQARAKLRGEDLVATEAVAQAKGVTIESARRHHTEEVKQVRAVARERVEAKPETRTVEEQVHVVAQNRERVRASAKANREDKKSRHTVRYIQAEGKISVAMQNLRSVLDDTEGVEFTSEERDLIAQTLGQLRALLNLLDVRIIGTADIDWDAEMAKLGDLA